MIHLIEEDSATDSQTKTVKMKLCAVILFTVVLTYSSLASPLDDSNAIVMHQQRDTELFGNTKKLIEDLVNNLRNAAKQAINAVGNFTVGIKEQLILFKEKVEKNIVQLKEKVMHAIQNIADRIQNSSGAVRECIEMQRENASALLNETLCKITECADSQIDRISGLMNDLAVLSNNAIESANDGLAQMQNCTEIHQGHFFTLGSCLGNVVIQCEIKGGVFVAQSGLMIARINLAVATLPAALEVCAGSRLVEAGMHTAQLIMKIGQCSVSSAFSAMVANN